MKKIFFVLVLICINQAVSYGQNVGIGTTSPLTHLHVKGAGDQEISIESTDAGGRRWTIQSNGNVSPSTFQIIDRTAVVSRLAIDNNGNVGIGITAAANKLDVKGALAIGENFSGTAAPANGAIIEGPVGIGTTIPAHKLEVRGNIWLGEQQPGAGFTTIQDVLYLGSPRKYLSNTLGAAIGGSDDWINLMAHPGSYGIILGLSGPSDTDPHSVPVPLMTLRSSGNVGIGVDIPNNSAKVDISSTSQGFLPPRMTAAQRNGISSPAQGLMIYCTDCGLTGGEPQYYNGGYWSNLTGAVAALPVPTVTIGATIWMQKNLDVTTYRNGDPIPQVTDGTTWAGLTTGAWCWYNNDSATYSSYGKLYNFYAVKDPRGLAPVGWQVSNDLVATAICLGGTDVAGGPLKEAGTSHWDSPNTGATNSSGFTALGSGFRSGANGSFAGIRTSASYWTTIIAATGLARYRYFNNTSTVMQYNNNYIAYASGLSVRCSKPKDLQVGDCLYGGIVAYIYQTGDPGYVAGQVHGILATKSDVSLSAEWGCNTVLIGGTSEALGSANLNSNAITSGCGTPNIAARLCEELILFNIYDFWHLPSKDDLNKLYLNKAVIGGFSAGSYWSSSEVNANNAWSQDFSSGAQANNSNKATTYYVRAVQYF